MGFCWEGWGRAYELFASVVEVVGGCGLISIVTGWPFVAC